MTKHARKSRRLQAVERPPAATVQIPRPVLGAFASIERSYFELCIRAGQQVLDAMMEQDRTALCGPRWKRDPDRQAGRAGTTPSEVTLPSFVQDVQVRTPCPPKIDAETWIDSP